jgi:hypothetical protein
MPNDAITYEHSNDINAYPENEIVGDVRYQYIGTPLTNSIHSPKMTLGSYVGTGMAGEDYPNTLSFDNRPDVILITRYGDREAAYCMMFRGGAFMQHYSPNAGSEGVIVWGEKDVTWYAKTSFSGSNSGTVDSTGGRFQMNESGVIYLYAAITCS